MKKIILLLLAFSISFIQTKDYPKPIPGYYSQKGQDKFLNEEIFHNKRNGIFIEVGAHDGISFSNTFFFEKNLGWKGICIEPNPDIYSKLINNRAAVCLPYGVAEKNEKRTYLKCSGFITEMYSGILDCMDERHKERIENEIAEFGGSTTTIEIECMPLKEIFKKQSITYIDFISIDIEGGEEEAIKSIDFNEVTITVIVVENNFNSDKIKNYLLPLGYEYITKIGKDDIYQLQGKM